MRILACECPDADVDVYAFAKYARNDLRTIFVDTPAGCGAKQTAGTWAMTVLQALGKSHEVAGLKDHVSETVAVLPVWLLAHDVRWVVLPDLNLIAPRTRHRLLEALAAGGTDLILVLRPYRVDNPMRQFLDGIGAEWISWNQAHDLLARPAKNPPTNKQKGRPPKESNFPEHVPSDDWPLFLETCKSTLPTDEFTLVRKTWRTAYDATRLKFKPARNDSDKIADDTMRQHLATITRDHPTRNHAITAIRGAQTGCFTRGYNLRIAIDQLMRTLDSARATELTDRDWTALRAYRDTCRAATCILHVHGGLPLNDLPTITCADANTMLHTQNINGVPLDARAKPFLTAHLTQRRLDGSEPDDPFLTLTLRQANAIVDRAARDIGLRTATRNPDPRSRFTLNFWQFRSGFQIENITTS